VALAGHRDTDFRSLERVSIGDEMSLRTIDGEYRYAIESIRIVSPRQVEVLEPADHATLTLVTCFPFRFIGRAPMRYVVRAREVARPPGMAI
jgi:sortase A